jgi:hypothetical protein
MTKVGLVAPQRNCDRPFNRIGDLALLIDDGDVQSVAILRVWDSSAEIDAR